MSPNELTYRQFEQLVATTSSILEGIDISNDLSGMYNRVGLENSPELGLSRSAIGNHIKFLIEQLPKPLDGNTTIDLNKWCKIGAIDSLLRNNGQATEGFLAAEALRSYLRQPVGVWLPQDWIHAVSLTKGLKDLNRSYESNDLRRSYREVFLMANAIILLSKHGCEIDYEDGDIVITAGEAQVIEKIEGAIRKYGALQFIRDIFHKLAKVYYSPADRILLSYAPQPNPDDNIPLPPWGFLLNLAAKHAHRQMEKVSGVESTQKMQEAELLARALLIITGTQRFHIFGAGMFSVDNAPKQIQQHLIFDAAFTFPQVSLDVQPTELSFLFGWVDSQKFSKKYSYSINQFIRVTEAISNLCKGKIGPVQIKRRDIYQSLGKDFPMDVLKKILTHIVHPFGTINTKFANLTDLTNVNVYHRPLAILTPDAGTSIYYVLDARWTAIGFYEVLYQMCRDFPEIINGTGAGLERLVKSLLSEHGISYYSGNYNALGFAGESDVLIETKDTIILMEVKKTQLTRTSQTGDPLHAFTDLSDTLIKSQEQAGRIEVILRKQGYIDLTDLTSNQTCRVSWNHRRIERVSVTHLDFHSLHDRVLIMRLLEILINVQLERTNDLPVPESVLARFQRMNVTLSKLTEQYRHIHPDGGQFADRPYFDCWFIPVGFLRLLLDGVTNADEFLAAMLKLKHLTFATGNLYQEHRIRHIAMSTSEPTASSTPME